MPPEPILAEFDGEPVRIRVYAHAAGGAVVLYIQREYESRAVVIDCAEVRRLLYALNCGHTKALQLQPTRVLVTTDA